MNGDERHRVSIDTERSVGVSKQSRVYPLLGSWSYCKPVQLPPARSGHSLVALTSKILLLFGGGPDENVSNEVYRIELSGKPGDKSVVCTYLHPNPKSQCPFERDRHSAWLWNGYMYIFGGEDVHGFMYSDIWKFDHKQLTWDEKAKCGETPSPRRGQTCTLVGSVVWIFGGLTFERDSVADVYTLDMERFEFKHKKHKAMPPCGRRGHSATAIDGYLYIFGGCDKTEVLLGDLWRLNLKTCVWEEVQPHFPGLGPPPSVGHAAAVFKNMLLTFGGNISSLKRESCSEVWLWDIQKGQWMQLKMKVEPQARSYHALVAQENEDILVFGGWSGYSSMNDFICISDGSNGTLKHFVADLIHRKNIKYQPVDKSESENLASHTPMTTPVLTSSSSSCSSEQNGSFHSCCSSL